MLIYKTKDATDIKQGIIAHGVNCQYKMAAGIAKTIRFRFPKAYDSYMNHKGGNDQIGEIDLVEVDKHLYVANVYTQIYYGNYARFADIDAIYKGMSDVASFAKSLKLAVFMPKIGCGLGGLSWEEEVKPVMEKIAENYLEVDFIVCEI